MRCSSRRRASVADHVHRVTAFGERHGELGCDDSGAAIGRIAADADLHRTHSGNQVERVRHGHRKAAEEGLSELGANEVSEVPGPPFHGTAEAGGRDLGDRFVAFRLRLRGRSAKRRRRARVLGLPASGHVDDEARLEAVVLHVREDGGRPVRVARAATGQAGVEARGVHQRVPSAVVGVAIRRRRSQDQLRAPSPEDLDHRVLLRLAGAQASVSESEELELARAQGLGRSLGLPSTLVRSAPGPRLTRGQVEDPDSSTRGRGDRKRSAAAELDVVRMRPDGHQLDAHGQDHRQAPRVEVHLLEDRLGQPVAESRVKVGDGERALGGTPVRGRGARAISPPGA